MMQRGILLLLSLLLPAAVFSEWGYCGQEGDLMRDLMIVENVDCGLQDRMPVYYDHLLQGGYFNMPSARMGAEGEIAVGYTYVSPYRHYNLRLQVLDRLELTGNYRVFHGMDDVNLSASGFGDFSDKGANVKLAIMHPEESDYVLPGIAIGWEDFMGTKAFEARYVVMTQVFPQWNTEISLGYGEKRFRRWFGGVMWLPFRQSCNTYLQGIALVGEYDAIPYKSTKREPHPDGRSQKSSINCGIKYRLWDLFDLSASYDKGEQFAFSASAVYNFGLSKGLLPKICDKLPYKSPVNTQPLGPLRPCDVLVQDLLYPLREQGFTLHEAWLSCNAGGRKVLRLRVWNAVYRYELEVRERLNALLANLIPSDIAEVVVVMEEDALPVQEYRFSMDYVRGYADKKICPYELFLLSPLCEARKPYGGSSLLFRNKRELWNYEVFPKIDTMFGSAKGKFKYAFGVYLGVNGFLWSDWYYNTLFSYNINTNLYEVKDVDKLNPSQLINVRTDVVNYYKQTGVAVDEAYIQKNWNLSRGWYTRVALGLFEEEYGGAATEFLYYPVCSKLAIGVEGAYLRKRTFTGVGFLDDIRKLDGYRPTYRKFRGSQYFANVWYNFEDLGVDLHLKGGKFLADDWGVRTELAKYYPSGMRIYFWYTHTDGKDRVNGHRYYDKGVGISIPLDLFSTRSMRNTWSYQMSAWLRDVGAISETGVKLYNTIRSNRENQIR